MSPRKKNKDVEDSKIKSSSDNIIKLKTLLEEFSAEISSGSKDKFHEFAADPAIDIVESIAHSESVPKEDRIAALTLIYDTTAKLIEQLQKLELSNVFWKNRQKNQRNLDPCQWVIEKFPSYNDGLTLNQIASHDPELYSALRTKKKKGLWPKNFELRTQDEANSIALEEYGGVPPTLKEIAEASPPHIRKMIRLHMLGRSRRYYKPQSK